MHIKMLAVWKGKEYVITNSMVEKLLENPTVIQLVNKLPILMETECSSLC
jgi:hypothetical protein